VCEERKREIILQYNFLLLFMVRLQFCFEFLLMVRLHIRLRVAVDGAAVVRVLVHLHICI